MSVCTVRNALIVDDYPAMLHLLRRILLDYGISNIDQATDGYSALAKLREHSYNLIISDLKMRPMSGLELLEAVRYDMQLKSVPFIMLTATGDSELVLAAKRAGVTDYILKPFRAETVLKKLEHIFGQTETGN